jgi:hypothetical protein
MNKNTAPTTITTADVARVAAILAEGTVRFAREEGTSLPGAYAYMRRAMAARWPHLAEVIPATYAELIRPAVTLAPCGDECDETCAMVDGQPTVAVRGYLGDGEGPCRCDCHAAAR